MVLWNVFFSYDIRVMCMQLVLRNCSQRKAVMMLGLGVDGLNPQTEHCGENLLCVNDSILY
jgi:hypothetical protein